MFGSDKDDNYKNNHTSGNWLSTDSTYRKLSDTLNKYGSYGSIFDYDKDDKSDNHE